MCKPAAPNLMKDFTVRAILKAPPHPVSASTNSGSEQASVMRVKAMEEIFGSLSAADRASLLNLLTKIRNNLPTGENNVL